MTSPYNIFAKGMERMDEVRCDLSAREARCCRPKGHDGDCWVVMWTTLAANLYEDGEQGLRPLVFFELTKGHGGESDDEFALFLGGAYEVMQKRGFDPDKPPSVRMGA